MNAGDETRPNGNFGYEGIATEGKCKSRTGVVAKYQDQFFSAEV